ncbi:MAG: hypothetical protein A2075_20945 [Geobacteraceae bacterium GWC2_58_44]|nr:MAG: hypothetical protein A2075_20945 [Geobacteraceae bacterium GWC2_58_44]HBG05252.1 hypothetical protein [Geobacter sp.]
MIEFVQKTGKETVVLFVHGFMGGKETWQNSKNENFPEMLLANKEIADYFDFAYFTYFTEFIEKKTTKKPLKLLRILFPKHIQPVKQNVTIEELSELLASQVRYDLNDYKKIVIISHSMGGLVSKCFILNELKEKSKSSVVLFLSLAVPHAGSELSTIGKLLLQNTQISDLGPLSDIIRYLNHHWLNTSNLPPAKYFYGQYDDVVPKNSALPLANTSDGVACECDHSSICKPEKLDSSIYRAVLQSLLDYKKNLDHANELSIKELACPDQSYMDELFVLKLLIADIHNVTINNAKTLFYNAEYMRKYYSDDASYESLNEMYIKIQDIYGHLFTKYAGGSISNGHQLIAEVYQKIEDQDHEILKTYLPFVQALHKKGMIHQLANIAEKQIWWDKDHSQATINAYLKNKVKE